MILATWCRLVLLASFATAFYIHTRDRARLRSVLGTLDVPAAAGVALVVTAADAAVAGLLLLAPPLGAAAGLAYLAAVSGFIAWRSSIKPVSDCGCGARPEPVDALFFVRNGALALAGVVLLTVGEPPILGVGFWIAVSLFVAWWTFRPLLDVLLGRRLLRAR